MRIINIIEYSNKTIQHVESFLIPNGEDSDEIVQKAEKLFLCKAEENGIDIFDEDYLLEEGIAEINDYQVFLNWSEVI